MKDNDNFKGNVDHSKYLITNFNNTFSSTNWKYGTTNEINKIIKSLRTKNSYGYDEIPINILKLSTPFIISPSPIFVTNPLPLGYSPKD